MSSSPLAEIGKKIFPFILKIVTFYYIVIILAFW